MDIRMPGGDGLDATGRIIADPSLGRARRDPDHLRPRRVRLRAVRIGASGFLVKDTEPAELLAGIRGVAAGERCFPERHPAADRRVRRPQPGSADPTALDALTEREREVVGSSARDSTTRRSARAYHESRHGQDHVSRAMTKLHARDRAQLVVIAYESGLVRPGLVLSSRGYSLGRTRARSCARRGAQVAPPGGLQAARSCEDR